MITLSYLEFYSGIGGWGYALEESCRSITAAASAPNQRDRQHVFAMPHNAKKPKVSIRNDIGHDNDDDGNEIQCTQGVELQAKLLAAYDHSDLCNSVFLHNHNYGNGPAKSSKKNQNKQCKPRQTPIEKLTLAELECHSATVWCMSPPCQPHTRQHSNQHLEREDPRSKSFLHLCHLLSEMEESVLPAWIFLENVIGFEKSCSSWREESDDDNEFVPSNTDGATNQEHQSRNNGGSFDTWRRSLMKRGYISAHFHLDPTNVGIPNNRPRHFTVAYHPGAVLRWLGRKETVLDMKTLLKFSQKRGKGHPAQKGGKHIFDLESIKKPPIIHNKNSISVEEKVIPCVSSFLDADLPPHALTPNPLKLSSVRIPQKIRSSSSSWCFDIVTPHHHRSSCFTHSYGKFIRGTGSILYTGPLSAGANVGDNALSARDESSGGDALDEKAWCNAVLGLYAKESGRGQPNSDEKYKKDTQNIPSVNQFQLALPEERAFDASWSEGLDWDRDMRYLSGAEIARLMGFPVAEPPAMRCDGDCPAKNLASGEGTVRKFRFPHDVTMRQQWKLLGNSLNVRVAAFVAEIGIQAALGCADVAKIEE
ncbi:hypothetical protein ACHAWF_006121 [Thalassiosira exigua]